MSGKKTFEDEDVEIADDYDRDDQQSLVSDKAHSTSKPVSVPFMGQSQGLWVHFMTVVFAAVVICVVLIGIGVALGNYSMNSKNTRKGTLLIISMDGFRADYLKSHIEYLPNIAAFFAGGLFIRPAYSRNSPFSHTHT